MLYVLSKKRNMKTRRVKSRRKRRGTGEKIVVGKFVSET